MKQNDVDNVTKVCLTLNNLKSYDKQCMANPWIVSHFYCLA